MSGSAAVGIVGAGVMGAGIAELAAATEAQAVLCDVDGGALDRAMIAIAAGLDARAARENRPGDWASKRAARVLLVDSTAALERCELVIEAVPERLQLKLGVLEEISGSCRPEAVIATNTSSIALTRLMHAVDFPERFVGMHFFYPPDPDAAGRADRFTAD